MERMSEAAEAAMADGVSRGTEGAEKGGTSAAWAERTRLRCVGGEMRRDGRDGCRKGKNRVEKNESVTSESRLPYKSRGLDVGLLLKLTIKIKPQKSRSNPYSTNQGLEVSDPYMLHTNGSGCLWWTRGSAHWLLRLSCYGKAERKVGGFGTTQKKKSYLYRAKDPRLVLVAFSMIDSNNWYYTTHYWF